MSTVRALEGMKILDFTRVYSGPYCTMLLADLGAEVIKVESVEKGDDTRNFAPIKDGVSGYYNYLNRNKRSITLNLKTDAGKKVAMELAQWADVIVENFSAGTIGKLGLGYEDVKKVNPEVIFASLSGFGQYGPYKNKLAFDAIAQAMGGLTSLSGSPDKPTKVTPALSDAITGIHMAFGVMIAAFHKQKTGKGQLVDVAMMDTVFSVLEGSVVIKTLLDSEPKRMGNASQICVPYDVYQAKDGDIVIACPNDSLFTKLAKVIGREDMLEDPRYNTNPARILAREEVDGAIKAWTIERTKAEIEKLLDEARIPSTPVKTIGELVDDPHIAAREMLIEQEDPIVGKVKYPGNPIKLQLTPPDFYRKAPQLGEHSAEILSSVLSYSQEAIDKLRAQGDI
ncbi:MAG: Formyl-CoA transferase [Firmicutes bacterium]|nr:Formyl-CoA transferase [Bacillota bacterium]